MPTAVSKTPSSVPPSTEEVSSLLNNIFNAEKSQQSLDGSYALANLLIQSVGVSGLQKYNVLPEVRKASTDKKNGAKRESAMLILGALLERFPPVHPLSEVVFLLQDGGVLDIALDALADKGAVVRESAQYAIDALFACLKPESLVNALLPALDRYLNQPKGKWQGFVAAYSLIEKMARKAQMGTGTKEEEEMKDLLREAMGKTLKDLIPIVESGMHDLKNEVAKQATKTMSTLTTLLSNDDVAPRIPIVMKTMEQPSEQTLQKAIHDLSQTTFVAVVTSPVLALLTPLLERSLNTPTTPQEVLRQTVIVVENLTKLVHDPAEARTFLPKLKPGVQSVKDRASHPDVRDIATSALSVMEKAMQDSDVAAGSVVKTTSEDVLAVLNSKIQEQGGLAVPEDAAFFDLARNYIAAMVREDVNCPMLDRIPLCTGPYLRGFLKDDKHETVASDLKTYFVEEHNRKFGQPVEDDSDEVEIVNANFSLAYGGMLLLSHTNLRLLKGHRYGLCGRNGTGKSTLLRSIGDNKLEGFPPPEEVKTCFVEHNQGEDADLSILEYVSRDPRIPESSQELISSVLLEFGFTAGPDGIQAQKVGSLSGGWKMKLALARAMLMKADVLLLDEPTNHLDVANVRWLMDYLKRHTDITSMIVSHDSNFLDEVCTDIYHYEQKKLVHYKGNLSE